jgi:hypothetical protein
MLNIKDHDETLCHVVQRLLPRICKRNLASFQNRLILRQNRCNFINPYAFARWFNTDNHPYGITIDFTSQKGLTGTVLPANKFINNKDHFCLFIDVESSSSKAFRFHRRCINLRIELNKGETLACAISRDGRIILNDSNDFTLIDSENNCHFFSDFIVSKQLHEITFNIVIKQK